MLIISPYGNTESQAGVMHASVRRNWNWSNPWRNCTLRNNLASQKSVWTQQKQFVRDIKRLVSILTVLKRKNIVVSTPSRTKRSISDPFMGAARIFSRGTKQMFCHKPSVNRKISRYILEKVKVYLQRRVKNTPVYFFSRKRSLCFQRSVFFFVYRVTN